MRSVVSLLVAFGLSLLSLPASAQEAFARAAPELGFGFRSAPPVAPVTAPALSGVFVAPALAPRSAAGLPATAVPAAAPFAAAAVAASPIAAPAAATAEPFAFAAPAAEVEAPTSAAAAPAAAPRAVPESRGVRILALASGLARALMPRRGAAPAPGDAVHAPASRLDAAVEGGSLRSPSAAHVPPPARTPEAAPGKRSFMAGTFVYNLATSVMLVVQQALFFTLAQADQLSRGVAAGPASLHAAGVVFALATLTGAMRIPGNWLGAWLSARTDQRNLAALSSGARAAILAAVGGLVVLHQMTLPLAALLYSADWLIGGLEEVSRNTQTPALVKPGTAEFKAWSTFSQFLAQLTGLFGPLFVIALAQFKGLDAAGHVLAPLLFGGAALLYARVPADAYHRASAAAPAPAERTPRLEKWRALLRDRALLLPILSLALMSTLLLKGPLSLNMASLLLGKSGTGLVSYSALLSGLFGAGLGAGAWLAHAQGAAPRAAARWTAVAAASTAALAASWAFGASPALTLPAIAAAWFFFALANAAGQTTLMHRLQERVAAPGPDRKYAVGFALTLSNVVITVLRVLAGLIFFVLAKNWETAFGLFGALMIAVALGQWGLSRALSREDDRVR